MADLRPHLEDALRADLVGPYSLDPSSTEVLEHAPLRWYITGFLAPEGTKPADESTEESDDSEAEDTDDDATTTDGAPKIPRRLPASIGLTVFAAPGARELVARASWGEYTRHQGEHGKTVAWQRSFSGPHDITITTDASGKADLPNRVELVWKVERTPDDSGLPNGTRVVNVFLVNRRPAQDGEALSASTIFQVALDVRGELVGRENRRGETSTDHDEVIADLQYRGLREWAVGHGVGAEPVHEGGEVVGARAVWLPVSEVAAVEARKESDVVVDMEALAAITTGDGVKAALGKLPEHYEKWIIEQASKDVGSEARRVTLQALIGKARFASKRIRQGLAVLEKDATCLRAFSIANQAMADAARKRGVVKADARAEWRLFQLAFVPPSM
jgi:hypothetical protein